MKLEDLANAVLADYRAVAQRAATKCRYRVVGAHVRLVVMALLVHGANGRRGLNREQIARLAGIGVTNVYRLLDAAIAEKLVGVASVDRAACCSPTTRHLVRWIVDLERLAELAAPAKRALTEEILPPLVQDPDGLARRGRRTSRGALMVGAEVVTADLVDARVLAARRDAMMALSVRPADLRLRERAGPREAAAVYDRALAVVERMRALWRARHPEAGTLSEKTAVWSIGLRPERVSAAKHRRAKSAEREAGEAGNVVEVVPACGPGLPEAVR